MDDLEKIRLAMHLYATAIQNEAERALVLLLYASLYAQVDYSAALQIASALVDKEAFDSARRILEKIPFDPEHNQYSDKDLLLGTAYAGLALDAKNAKNLKFINYYAQLAEQHFDYALGITPTRIAIIDYYINFLEEFYEENGGVSKIGLAKIIAIYEKAIIENKEKFALYANLASYYYQDDQWEKAISNADQAIALEALQTQRNPHVITAHITLGFAKLELKQFEQAMQHFANALTLDFASINAHVGEGFYYLHTGKFALAEETFNTLNKIANQQNAGYLLGLSLACHYSDLEAAKKYWDAAWLLKPNLGSMKNLQPYLKLKKQFISEEKVKVVKAEQDKKRKRDGNEEEDGNLEKIPRFEMKK